MSDAVAHPDRNEKNSCDEGQLAHEADRSRAAGSVRPSQARTLEVVRSVRTAGFAAGTGTKLIGLYRTEMRPWV